MFGLFFFLRSSGRLWIQSPSLRPALQHWQVHIACDRLYYRVNMLQWPNCLDSGACFFE